MQVSDRGIKNKLLKKYTCCELCGDTRNLEVHHIIPLSVGGPDIEDNMIVVCYKCHALLTPKSVLTKLGIQRVKDNNQKIIKQVKDNTQKMLNKNQKMIEFYECLDAIMGVDDNYVPTVSEIIDIVENVFGR